MTSVDSSTRNVQGEPLLRWRFPALLLFLAVVVWPVDRTIVDLLNPDESHALDGAARWLDAWSTRLLVGMALLATFASFLHDRLKGWRAPVTAWATGWILTDLLVRVFKTLAGRPRPCHPDGMGDSLRALFDRCDTMSLPSGHTATAAAFAVWGWVYLPRTWMKWGMVAFAAAIGLGRTYIGAHYLSDVLAGAAVGWACMALAHHLLPIGYPFLVRLDVGGQHRVAWIFSGAVMLTWIGNVSVGLMNPMTGEAVTAFRLERDFLHVLFEPIFGPGARLAAQPDLVAFCQDSLMWAVIIVSLAACWMRRRVLGWIALGLFWVGSVMWVAFGGVSPAGRLAPKDPSSHLVLADLQNHSGDPVDGHISLEGGLQLAGSAGLNLVQTTYHNRWSSVQVLADGKAWHSPDTGLFGMEWSAGDHREAPLHLLVFNRQPEPVDLMDERDFSRLIARVHEAGGLVVASHFWRGKATELPTAEQLIAAGIDGFEVCGRSQEYRPEQLRRQEELRVLTKTHGLLALASSDFHGRRGHVYQWMAVERKDLENPVDVLWEALNQRDRTIQIITRETAVPGAGLPRILIPWHVVIRYMREMKPSARAVWLFWVWTLALGWRLRSTRSQRRSRLPA